MGRQVGGGGGDPGGMKLHLALEPLLPLRAPAPQDRALAHGYRLRLDGGPALLPDDPLLRAFGARAVELHTDDEEALQDEAFDPGRPLSLAPEPAAPSEVGVWDAEGVRRPGTLTTSFEWAARAALDHGLDLGAFAVREMRDVHDDRRLGLRVLVFSPAFVTVAPAAAAFERPRRARRPRLVLLADGTADVRWWDPTAGAGPLPAEDVPVSAELAEQLAHLRRRFAELPGEAEGLDPFHLGMVRGALQAEAARLWRRARAELGRRYAVGFLGPGMHAPVWSPAELQEEQDDECPF